MDPFEDFAAAQQSLTSNLVAATRTVASIAGEDIAFHRSVRPEVAESLDQKSLSLLRLTEKLLHRSTKIPLSHDQQITLPDADSIDLQWKKIIDVADGLLENADKCLDQFTGLVKPHQQANFPKVDSRSSLNASRLLKEIHRFKQRCHGKVHLVAPFKMQRSQSRNRRSITRLSTMQRAPSNRFYLQSQMPSHRIVRASN